MSIKTHLEDVFHVASADFIWDIYTRRESHLSNLGQESNWQVRPRWLIGCGKNDFASYFLMALCLISIGQ